MPTKTKLRKKDFIPFTYSLAFGPETAAPEGMVLMRIERNGVITHEERMVPEEFLNLAKAFEDVARGIRNVLEGRPVG
jgi:hypothetical protein